MSFIVQLVIDKDVPSQTGCKSSPLLSISWIKRPIVVSLPPTSGASIYSCVVFQMLCSFSIQVIYLEDINLDFCSVFFRDFRYIHNARRSFTVMISITVCGISEGFLIMKIALHLLFLTTLLLQQQLIQDISP